MIRTPIWEKGRADSEGRLGGLNDEDRARYSTPIDGHALTSARRRTRYLFGNDARFRALIAWLLPDRWSDALVQWVFRRAAAE